MSDLAAPTALLADNLGRLQHPTEGELNFVPLQSDSELAKTLRQHFAEAIIALLDNSGHLNTTDDDPTASVTNGQIVRLVCSQCGHLIIATNTARPISGKTIIEHLASLDAGCPHKPLTLETQRQRIQDALAAQDNA